MALIAFDFETEPFGPEKLAPPPVCISTYEQGKQPVLVASCEPEFKATFEHVLQQDTIVGHNVAFDMAVAIHAWPDLTTKVFDAYAEGRVKCTKVREMLNVLATTGNMDNRIAPDGTNIPLRYGLADLEKKHLGVDRSHLKEGEDVWRKNYHNLIGLPAAEYPEEASRYAIEDAVYTLGCYMKQRPSPVEDMQVRADFALFLQSCVGFAIDAPLVKQRIEELGSAFEDHNFPLAVECGILDASARPRPNKKQIPKALEFLGLTEEPRVWTEYQELLEEQGFKFTKGKPHSTVKQGPLFELIEKACKDAGVKPSRTPSGNPSFDAEAKIELRTYHPVLEELTSRDEIKKLVTTELPRIAETGVVHPKYRILKATGRCSSFGNGKDKDPAYPACNIQQIDPRVRDCYIARPGKVLCSVDYSAMELCTLAQKVYDLFGRSKLKDLINDGHDPHAYLGAQMCYFLDKEFRDSVRSSGAEIFEAFKELETVDPKKYGHYRKFAKPTGLGFPGGLGAETFVTYAKATYGVDMVEMFGGFQAAVEMAKSLKELWLRTFPEMEDYFRWIREDCIDWEWSTPEEKRYWYTSPLGMVRRNTTYCAAANGAALQTPGAEGAKIPQFDLARECWDPSLKSPLLGDRPIAFIHDEDIVELDEEYAHITAHRIAEILVAGMRQVVKDVKIKAEPALMYRWDKRAEAVYDDTGKLIPWLPPENNAAA